jgi:hypothetical protein
MMSHAMECTLFYVLALGLHIVHHGVEASGGVLGGSLVLVMLPLYAILEGRHVLPFAVV